MDTMVDLATPEKEGGLIVEVTYRNKKLEEVCTNAEVAQKTYGEANAIKIHQRMGEISAAENVEFMIRFRIGRCHLLAGNRKGRYAVDLIHPLRLVFSISGRQVEIANIEEIVDYH